MSVPGILEREQEQSVVYGSIDFGKTVVSNSKYIDLLQKAGSQLKIMPHTVLNDKEQEVRRLLFLLLLLLLLFLLLLLIFKSQNLYRAYSCFSLHVKNILFLLNRNNKTGYKIKI